MTAPIKLCHIYAQEQPHGEARIVLNRAALANLKKALNNLTEVADRGDDPNRMYRAKIDLLTSDGEGYELMVILDDRDWQSEAWQSRYLPYTDPVAWRCANLGKIKPEGGDER
ncbi:hypothetical protein [Tumebacillus lipolyticus]|uniref:Uncharacterized protein n=1 Tax=Tumebacillus lipolyticus TaxID=1280370 RepID=A0ABW5A4A9_9BACL